MSIIIYVDRGVDGASLKQLITSLKEEIDVSRHPIRRLDAERIEKEDWEQEATLLIVPGGRDVYYDSALSQDSIYKMRNFVLNGGTYLGICAGAYFASSSIEFEKGGRFEVLAERKLKFFPDMAVGPALGLNKYSYENERGAEAAELFWKDGSSVPVYYNGGCFFANADNYPSVEVLGRYGSLKEKHPAIISCAVGKGKALLSGLHLEYSASFLTPNNSYLERLHPLLQKGEEQRRSIFREILATLKIL